MLGSLSTRLPALALWTVHVLQTSLPNASNDTDWVAVWNNSNFYQGVFGPYFQQIGEPMVTALLGTFYVVSLWWYTESLFPPAVVLVLFVGVLLFSVPPVFAAVGTLVVTIALAMAYSSVFGGDQ